MMMLPTKIRTDGMLKGNHRPNIADDNTSLGNENTVPNIVLRRNMQDSQSQELGRGFSKMVDGHSPSGTVAVLSDSFHTALRYGSFWISENGMVLPVTTSSSSSFWTSLWYSGCNTRKNNRLVIAEAVCMRVKRDLAPIQTDIRYRH